MEKTNQIIWPGRPGHVRAMIEELQAAHPDVLAVETLTQYVGTPVYLVTVVDRKKPPAGPGVRFSQPHAHEPAATVGMLSVLKELLTGADLYGRPTRLDREAVLRSFPVSFIPDGNPDGRVWGPLQRKIVQVNVKVQNNNPRTPPRQQAELEAEAIRATIEFYLHEEGS